MPVLILGVEFISWPVLLSDNQTKVYCITHEIWNKRLCIWEPRSLL